MDNNSAATAEMKRMMQAIDNIESGNDTSFEHEFVSVDNEEIERQQIEENKASIGLNELNVMKTIYQYNMKRLKIGLNEFKQSYKKSKDMDIVKKLHEKNIVRAEHDLMDSHWFIDEAYVQLLEEHFEDLGENVNLGNQEDDTFGTWETRDIEVKRLGTRINESSKNDHHNQRSFEYKL